MNIKFLAKVHKEWSIVSAEVTKDGEKYVLNADKDISEFDDYTVNVTDTAVHFSPRATYAILERDGVAV